MEYTRSIGSYYETFEGDPEEIIKLVKALSHKADEIKFPRSSLPSIHSKVPDIKMPNIPPAKLSPHILAAAEMTRSLRRESTK